MTEYSICLIRGKIDDVIDKSHLYGVKMYPVEKTGGRGFCFQVEEKIGEMHPFVDYLYDNDNVDVIKRFGAMGLPQ